MANKQFLDKDGVDRLAQGLKAKIPTKVSQLTNDSGFKTTDNDTKNTAGSTDTSSKIFLVGATSQAANPQTYSHDTAYVGTDGCLYSNSKKVLTDHQSLSGLVPTSRTVNGKALSTDISLTAADVGALPSTTTIPTVNNATLTIQKNGTAVKTFTANASTDVTCNITVPTKTSELTNDSGFKTTDNNTTYSLTQDTTDGHKITLTPSSGTAQTITIPDNNTTYSFATGDANGQIKVTPNGGTAQNIDVKGLGAAAYTDSTDYASANSGMVAYGTCTTAAATAAKEVTVADSNWTLKVGNIVAVKYTNTNTASNCTLNVNGSGAKQIWYNTAVQTGTTSGYFGYANRTLFYMYDGTYWVLFYFGYDANDNTYDRTFLNYERRYAGKTLQPYHLCMIDVNGKLQGINDTAGNGTAHVANTTPVRPDKIYYYSSGTAVAAGGACGDNTLYEIIPVSSNYQFNANIPAYNSAYLVGNYDATIGLFTLDSTSANSYYLYVANNTTLTLSSIFTTGKYYIYVGASDETANHLQLTSVHTMYYFDGTNLVPTDGPTILNGTTAPTATQGKNGDIYVQYTA